MTEIVIAFVLVALLIVGGFTGITFLFLKHLKELEIMLKSKDPIEVKEYKDSFAPVEAQKELPVESIDWVDVTGGQSIAELMTK